MREQKRATSLLKAATVVMLALMLVACGSQGGTQGGTTGGSTASPSGGSQTQGSSQGASDAEAQLRITWAGSQVRHDATLKALELYSKTFPQVSFEPEYMGWDTYFTKLATQSAAKTLPDVMQIDTANLMDYALRGQLADLSQGIRTDGIDPNLINAGKVNGVLYGFPLGANAVSFLYNKVALENLNAPLPKEGWTWDDWVAMAREVQPKLEKGKYVLEDLSVSVGTDEVDKYEMYQLAHGKGFAHTPDGGFNIDKDTFVAFHQFFKGLRDEGLVPPIDVTISHKEYDPQLDNLVNGSVLVLRNFAAAFGAFDAIKPGQFAMTNVPRGTHSGDFLLPTQFFTISANSPHVEAAKAFIDWFVHDVEAGKALMLSRGKQASQAVSDAIAPMLSEGEQVQNEMIDKAAKDANPFTSRPKGFGIWTDEYAKISQEIGFGRKTPEEGFEDLKKRYAEIVQ